GLAPVERSAAFPDQELHQLAVGALRRPRAHESENEQRQRDDARSVPAPASPASPHESPSAAANLPAGGPDSPTPCAALPAARLDGVETGIRNLIRARPLEVEEVSVDGNRLRVPTLAEITRIKAWLCLMRNATRDYLDFVALADRMGERAAAAVVATLDDYYA